MTRLIQIFMLMMLLPPSLIAQKEHNRPETDQTGAAGAVRSGAPVPERTQVLFPEPSSYTTSMSALGQQAKSQSQHKPKPPKPATPSSEINRPPIEGSMVGYIDNAIVGSQIRFRMDAGFDDNRPDRAEFFYAQCGCNPGGPPGPQPGLVTHLNFQQLYMRAEYAPVKRFSVFAEVPVRWVQPQNFVPNLGSFTNQAGISDVQAGFKFAMLATQEHYLTFQFRADFPSGDSRKGLGTNHYSVEPSLLFFQKLTDRMSFEAQIGDWHPIGGSTAPIISPTGPVKDFVGDIFTYGFGPSYELYRGERVRFASVFELVGWRVLGGLETNGELAQRTPSVFPIVPSDGTNIVNLKVGARTTIGGHNSFYIGFGQAVTHELWYKHIIRFEYRYSF